MKKNEELGITLIALIVTIIVLLILASIGINYIYGDNGILNQSQMAKEKYDESSSKEMLLEKISELAIKIRTEQDRTLSVSDLKDLDLSDGSGNVEMVGSNNNITGAVITYNNYEFSFDTNIKIVDKTQIKLVADVGSVVEEKSIFEVLQNVIYNGNGNYTLKISGKTTAGTQETVSYPINLIKYDGNLILDGTTSVTGATLSSKVYEFGDNTKDVATSSVNANNTVILMVNGDLTINAGVTLTACKSASGYGGPKGLIIYCTGTLTNDGTISMTARGSKAAGQNVYLYRNNDSSYEYVPAIGGIGGLVTSASGTNNVNGVNGKNGTSGVNRQTGGGGSGAVNRWSNGTSTLNGAKGGDGTSFSGGSGSGGTARHVSGSWTFTNSSIPSSIGGAGGSGNAYQGNPSSANPKLGSGGGAGNNGGVRSCWDKYRNRGKLHSRN